MEDKASSSGKYDKALEEFEAYLRVMRGPRIDYATQCEIMGKMQATMAAFGIRVTNVSTCIWSDEEGSYTTFTYEYKWVPTDGSKPIPRWDTGVVCVQGIASLSICQAYAKIFRIVLEARDALREMPKQVMDL